MVHVRGKGGRQVPLLMDNVVEAALGALLKVRGDVGVGRQHIYVCCPNERGLIKPLRGNDCLYKALQDVNGLKHSERIRSTELRTYCATVSQIADLSGKRCWLAGRSLGA